MSMAKRPTAEMIAEGLSVLERVLLFCLASTTERATSSGVARKNSRRLLTMFTRKCAKRSCMAFSMPTASLEKNRA